MDDPLDNQEERSLEGEHSEEGSEPSESHNLIPAAEPGISETTPSAILSRTLQRSAILDQNETARRRSLRHNLLLLLSFTLAAFILATWIFVRVDSPFGNFLVGPQEVVREQLQALDRGQIRPAYNMFSARYRQQVSFDLWRELIATHWRMFHVEVLSAGEPAQTGAHATLEMVLRGADQKAYRAQFTLVRMDGRWWIDDLHWAEEPDPRNLFRT